MYKFRIAIFNLICTSLAGALMQIIWVLLNNKNEKLTLYGVVNMMVISAIIGTICLFALFYITLRNMGSLLKAILTNVFLVLFLCVLVYLQTGLFFSIWSVDFKWVIILIVALATALILTTFWYKKIMYYDSKLKMKKASLQKND